LGGDVRVVVEVDDAVVVVVDVEADVEVELVVGGWYAMCVN
jgi:hypothetical protein